MQETPKKTRKRSLMPGIQLDIAPVIRCTKRAPHHVHVLLLVQLDGLRNNTLLGIMDERNANASLGPIVLVLVLEDDVDEVRLLVCAARLAETRRMITTTTYGESAN